MYSEVDTRPILGLDQIGGVRAGHQVSGFAPESNVGISAGAIAKEMPATLLERTVKGRHDLDVAETRIKCQAAKQKELPDSSVF